jgi:hypothetical protein
LTDFIIQKSRRTMQTAMKPMPLRRFSSPKRSQADLSIELAEATLYADDGPAEVVKEFKSGTLSLGIDDIGKTTAEDLTSRRCRSTRTTAWSFRGFRGWRRSCCYRFPCQEVQWKIQATYWLYRVKFGVPATNLATKGDSITFSTPTIEGTVLRRNKLRRRTANTRGKRRHWRAM